MNKEKRECEKPPSLTLQNNNLKDYIIAMNYYLSGRCKDFSSLLRDLPERALVKEIGDLVTIYELLKEDINNDRSLITATQTEANSVREKCL
jgi:hypothetical protein